MISGVYKMNRQYHKSIFAFLDLLGVKENIKKDTGEFLNKLGAIYDSTLRVYKSVCKREFKDSIRTKIFSDNIVFECEIRNGDGFEEFKQIAFISAILQEELLENNLLLRGAITIGESYLDDVLVFGKTLSEAYILESTTALYPRVIISKELTKIVCQNKLFLPPISYMCVLDRDGEYYIDYLSSAGRNKNQREKLLRSALAYNEKELRCSDYSAKVKQKLLWHNDYLKMKQNQL